MLRYVTSAHEIALTKNDNGTYTLTVRDRQNQLNSTAQHVVLPYVEMIQVLGAFKSYIEEGN